MSLQKSVSLTEIAKLKPAFAGCEGISLGAPAWMPNLTLPAGTAIARFTAGGNLGKYTRYIAAGTNGQGVTVGFLHFGITTDGSGNIIRTYNPYGVNSAYEDHVPFYAFKGVFKLTDLKICSSDAGAVLAYTGNEAAYATMAAQVGRVLDGLVSMF